ncbi:hypothetical protein AB6C40_01550 [Vibrio splendidus]
MRLKSLFKKQVLVLGDSHVLVFENSHITERYKDFFFNICSVGGATLSGLDNPNSKTKAMPTFSSEIKINKPKFIIINLGEVDMGFVIWYRNQYNNISIQEALDKAVKNYIRLILNAKNKADVICISAPLPTIKDDQDWGEVANLRGSISATQRERTELTKEFNSLIDQFCSKNAVRYINLDCRSSDYDGLVSKSLLNDDELNHHYDNNKYSKILISYLDKILR